MPLPEFASPAAAQEELAAIDKRLAELEAEKQRLVQRKQALLRSPPAHAQLMLSPEQKVQLFRDLFSGRTDMFAVRWQNAQGRHGYSVACHNEWVPGVCQKRNGVVGIIGGGKKKPTEEIDIATYQSLIDKRDNTVSEYVQRYPIGGELMTEDIRWRQRFSNYRKALSKLREAVELSRQRPLSELEKQGLIQAFEYTHELAWKTLKDFLEYQGQSDLYGSRDVSRKAFELGLVSDGNGWMDMIKSRNLTFHTYNQETADQISNQILALYHELFNALERKLESVAGHEK